jgi:hypothetical protein
MSDLAFYALAIVLMYLGYRLLKWNNRKKAAMRAPERQAEAAQRGWTYEQEQTAIFEIERWQGTTDGVEWVGETARSGTRRSLDGTRLNRSVTLVTRWHTKQRMPVSGAVLLMHTDGAKQPEEIAGAVKEIDSALIRKLTGTLLDVGLDVRFGQPLGASVEGTQLKPGTLPATGYDGYSLMADNPDEASALAHGRLAKGLDAARAAAAPEAPSVLITAIGLAISVPRWTSRADELVPIVNAGMALTRALR